jgi:monoamine oxidase
VNYACRDDYGSDYALVSAWAGLHYFASRDGRAQDAESDQVLTWPEGNGWLTKRIRERMAARVETGALVHRIEETRNGVEIDVLDVRQNRRTCLRTPPQSWPQRRGRCTTRRGWWQI